MLAGPGCRPGHGAERGEEGHVGADATGRTRRVVGTVGVIAVDIAVAVVVHAVITDFGVRGARRVAGTVGVVAVDATVAVVVHAVITDFGVRGARRVAGTVGVIAVDIAVAIVVHAVVTDLVRRATVARSKRQRQCVVARRGAAVAIDEHVVGRRPGGIDLNL